MGTVFTTMKRSRQMAEALGQKTSVQTFDQQLYAVAKQVQWANPELFKDHIIRLGGFHALSCFIAAVGKLWSAGGLRDILVDSGIYASCTVDQMLSGKQFNRAVRGLTIVYEALMSLMLTSFFRWCVTRDQLSEIPADFWSCLKKCRSVYKDEYDLFPSNFNDVEAMFQEHVLPIFNSFREFSCNQSPTFKYWDMFLTATSILLQNIKAERTGSWSQQLDSVIQMIPYFFVTNKVNYSRWMPVYIIDMINIPVEIQSAFFRGEFAIRQTVGAFKGVWSDMATEKTVIRDSKGCSGIVGITQQKSALIRWSVTRHMLGHFSNEMRKRSEGEQNVNSSHEETKPAGLKRDETHVADLINHIKENMTDPFNIENHPPNLMNIATGMHASDNVSKSLLKSVEVGSEMAKTFIEGSFSDEKDRSFNSPISKSGIKTFEDMTKPVNLKCNSGDVIKAHINPEVIFRRAQVLANAREDITVEKILSFQIGPIPTSLFHDDGTMRKNCKADISHQLENETSNVCQSPPDFDPSLSVVIRDGMALFQAMNPKAYKTFGDLLCGYIQMQLTCIQNAAMVVDVFDRYDIKNSIKGAERERRSKRNLAPRVFDVIEGRTIPDWKKFLSSGTNKQAIIRFNGDFIVKYHANACPTSLKFGQSIILAGAFLDPETVKQIDMNGVSNCPELCSTQEEADTRLVLHVLHADGLFTQKQKMGRIVVKSPNTDVFVLLIHFFPKLNFTSELWLQVGTITSTKDCRRYIPVHEVYNSMSPLLCKVLPAAHALTGCDTTSGFFHIGKKSLFKCLKANPERYQDLYKIGDVDIDNAVELSRELVSNLYDTKKKANECQHDLNKLRVKLLNSKDCSLSRLPPSEAAFRQHVMRSSLQTKIWMTADQAKPPAVSPLTYGWREGQFGLEPIPFEGPMSSDFLQDLICLCKGKSVCSRQCICFGQNLSCTELCSCEGNESCCNVYTSFVESVEEET